MKLAIELDSRTSLALENYLHDRHQSPERACEDMIEKALEEGQPKCECGEEPTVYRCQHCDDEAMAEAECDRCNNMATVHLCSTHEEDLRDDRQEQAAAASQVRQLEATNRTLEQELEHVKHNHEVVAEQRDRLVGELRELRAYKKTGPEIAGKTVVLSRADFKAAWRLRDFASSDATFAQTAGLAFVRGFAYAGTGQYIVRTPVETAGIVKGVPSDGVSEDVPFVLPMWLCAALNDFEQPISLTIGPSHSHVRCGSLDITWAHRDPLPFEQVIPSAWVSEYTTDSKSALAKLAEVPAVDIPGNHKADAIRLGSLLYPRKQVLTAIKLLKCLLVSFKLQDDLSLPLRIDGQNGALALVMPYRE